MKRQWVIVSVVVLVVAGYFGYQALGQSVEEYPMTMMGISEFDAFKSLAEVEQAAELIVQARFTGERELLEIELPGGSSLFYSTSRVEVQEAFKGDLGATKLIKIIEPGAFHNQRYMHDGGYNLMNKQGRYILFLRKVREEENAYATVGAYQGKYDLNVTDPARQVRSGETYGKVMNLDYFGENDKRFNHLKDEVVAKYQ